MCEVEGVELYWTWIGKIMTVKTWKNFTNIHTPTTDRRNLVYVSSIFGFASTNYPFGEEKFLFTYTTLYLNPKPLLLYQSIRKFSKFACTSRAFIMSPR